MGRENLLVLLLIGVVCIGGCRQSDEKSHTAIEFAVETAKDGLPAVFTELDHQAVVSVRASATDGGLLATGATDNTVKLWSTSNQQIVRTLVGHEAGISALCFSEGGLLASGSYDESVRVWSTDTGQLVHRLVGHERYIEHIAFSQAGDFVVSADKGGDIRLWSLADGRLFRQFNVDEISAVAFYGRDSLLVSRAGRPDVVINVMNNTVAEESGHGVEKKTVRSGKVLPQYKAGRGWSRAMAVSPGQRWLVSGHGDGSIRIWDVEARVQLKILQGHSKEVYSLAISPDGTLLSSAADNTLKAWDLDSGELLRELSFTSSLVHAITISKDGSRAAASNMDKVFVWDLRDDTMVSSFSAGSYVFDLAFSTDAKRLLIGTEDNYMKLWSALDGRLLKTYPAHTGDVMAVAFSPDNREVASASLDKTIRVYNAKTGRILKSMMGHTREVTDVDFSNNGRYLISASMDKTVRLWDGYKGQLLSTFTGHTEGVRKVFFLDQEKKLVSSALDASLRLWEIKSNKNTSALFSLMNGEWVSFDGTNSLYSSRQALEKIKIKQGKKNYLLRRWVDIQKTDPQSVMSGLEKKNSSTSRPMVSDLEGVL